MPFAVRWRRGPQAALAQIWLRAPDRQAVTDAANEIDRRLRLYPMSAGSASGAVYHLHVSPLEVTYKVSAKRQRVKVLLVRFRP